MRLKRLSVCADWLVTDPLSAAPVPDYLTNVEAACLPTAGLTAWRALVTDGNVRPGDVVVVQGTGGVALFALQFAKLLGAYAIVLSSSDEKLAKAQALGADEVLNYVKEPAWGRTVKAMAQRLSGRDDFLAMCSAMARVQMRPVVDSVYPFEALKDALAHLKSGRHFGKVCIQLA